MPRPTSILRLLHLLLLLLTTSEGFQSAALPPSFIPAASLAASTSTTDPTSAFTADVPSSLRLLSDAAGDDIRGITSSSAAVPLLPRDVRRIGAAFRQWLGPSSGPVAVGRDPRPSSPELATAFLRGCGGGVDAGLATTPAMLERLLGTVGGCGGAAMVTASHLPSEWNGLKLFSAKSGRGLNRAEVGEVMQIALEMDEEENFDLDVAEATQVEETVLQDAGFMEAYVEKLRATVRACAREASPDPLRGMKVCVNPGNGGGGFFATRVLSPLGADVSPSIHLRPDGTFPAHVPDPESGAHVDATAAAVAASGADVGVMFDTDVDRCGLIDGTRSPPEAVNRNRLIALCTQNALETAGDTSGAIVTDSVTSRGLGDFIRSRGGTHDRYKMGYRNVIDRAAETRPEPALLAIETSGHSAWRDNAFVDDGCYTAARLLGSLARERRERGARRGLLDQLGGGLEEPAEGIKVRLPVMGGLGAVPKAEEALVEALKQCERETEGWEVDPVNYDGLRCKAGDGWLIVRASLHEPLVSVQTESDREGGTAEICRHLLGFVLEGGACEAAGIDVGPLRDASE